MNADNFQIRYCAYDGPDHIVSFPHDFNGFLQALDFADENNEEIWTGLYENVDGLLMHIVDFNSEGKVV